MHPSVSCPTLSTLAKIQTHPPATNASKMRKSVSANGLSEMAVDAIKYVPAQKIASCMLEYATTSTGQPIDPKDFATCIATPPELSFRGELHSVQQQLNQRPYHAEEHYNRRFQELYEIIKRRRSLASKNEDDVDEETQN